jgi:hypothetical protein
MEKFITKAYFGKFEKKIDQRFKQVDAKFEQLATMIGKGFQEVDQKFEKLENNLRLEMRQMIKEVDVRPRLDNLERRVDRLEVRKK